MAQVKLVCSEIRVESRLYGDTHARAGDELGAKCVFYLPRMLGCGSHMILHARGGVQQSTFSDVMMSFTLNEDISTLLKGGSYKAKSMALIGMEMRARRHHSDAGEKVENTVGHVHPPILMSELLALSKTGGGMIERDVVDLCGQHEDDYEQVEGAGSRWVKGRILMRVTSFEVPDRFEIDDSSNASMWSYMSTTHSPSRAYKEITSGDIHQHFSTDNHNNIRVPTLISAYYNRTYDVYNQKGSFAVFRPLEEKWRTYIVPDYVTSTDILMPSAAATTFSLFDMPSPEELYVKHLRMGYGDWGIASGHAFIESCKHILEVDDRAFDVDRCVGEPQKHVLPLDCLNAIGAICTGLFTNLSSALPYTNDTSVDAVDGKVRDVDRLCTNIHEMVAGDCEDGACMHIRTYMALVRNMNVWVSEELRFACRVLDRYRIVNCKMICGGEPNNGGGRYQSDGEQKDDGVCHIHAPLVHREYLYGSLCNGVDRAKRYGVYTEETSRRLKMASFESCYWEPWVYNRHKTKVRGRCTGMHPGSTVDEIRQYVARRAEKSTRDRGFIDGGVGINEFNNHPLPLVLYLESTNVVPPYQMPIELIYKDDNAKREMENIKRRKSEHAMLRGILSDYYRSIGGTNRANEWMNFDSWWCTDSMSLAFSTPERDTSAFYRGFYSASILNAPLLVAIEDDILQCGIDKRRGYDNTIDDFPRVNMLFGGGELESPDAPSSPLYFMDVAFLQSEAPLLGVHHKHFASGSSNVGLMPACFVRRDEFICMYYACSLEPPIESLVCASDDSSVSSTIVVPRARKAHLRVHPAFYQSAAVEYLRTHLHMSTTVSIDTKKEALGDWRSPFYETCALDREKFERILVQLNIADADIEELYKYTDRGYAMRRAMTLIAVSVADREVFVHDVYEYALRKAVCLIRVFVN